MNIEQVATSKIIEVISLTDYLNPFINSGDKEPIWDGFIYAYRKKDKTNESFIGRAALQIKGKKEENLSNNYITYPIRTSDLKNYKKDTGAIYFVVLITTNGQKRIYYNALLPYDINNILKDKEEQKTVSLKLKVFPENKIEVENIIINFIKDKERQSVLINRDNISLDEITRKIPTKEIKYSVYYPNISQKNDFSYLYDHDFYIYVKNEMGLEIPIEHCERISEIGHLVSGEVCVGKTKYYRQYMLRKSKNNLVIEIDKSISISINQEKSITVNFKLRGNLKEQIKSEQLIIEMISQENIIIDGKKIDVLLTNEKKEEFKSKKFEEHLQALQDIQKTLDYFGATVTLELDNLTEKDKIRLDSLMRAANSHETIYFKNPIPLVAKYSIANLVLLLYFIPQSDGTYKIENFFTYVIPCQSYFENSEESFATSQFCSLTENEFNEVSNISYESIYSNVTKYNNEGHRIYVNKLVLSILNAYDKINNNELLQTALKLSKWLYNKEKNDEELLNIYQCYLRIRNLSQDENAKILKIIENNMQNNILLLGCNILLDNNKMAEYYFDKLDLKEKQQFITYPIYSLWKMRNK